MELDFDIEIKFFFINWSSLVVCRNKGPKFNYCQTWEAIMVRHWWDFAFICPFLKSCLTTFLLFFLAHLFSLFPSLLVSPNHFLPLFFPLPSSPFPPFASYYFPHPRYRPPKRQWKFREGASNLGPFRCIIGLFLDYQIYSILYIHKTLCANWMNHWTHWVCYERIYSRAILDSWSFLKVYVVQMKHNFFATILLSKSEISFNFKYQYMW
jgi:hypothetical protein